jgi:hypothetical protein
VANGIAPLLVGLIMVAATGTSVALTPIQKPNEDVAFLERVAVSVELAQGIAPDTRDYLSGLARRHGSALADSKLDLRRRKALERIAVASRRTD